MYIIMYKYSTIPTSTKSFSFQYVNELFSSSPLPFDVIPDLIGDLFHHTGTKTAQTAKATLNGTKRV